MGRDVRSPTWQRTDSHYLIDRLRPSRYGEPTKQTMYAQSSIVSYLVSLLIRTTAPDLSQDLNNLVHSCRRRRCFNEVFWSRSSATGARSSNGTRGAPPTQETATTLEILSPRPGPRQGWPAIHDRLNSTIQRQHLGSRLSR